MKVILQNVTITAIGFLIGSAVNMGLIMISGQIIPPPEGADVTTMEGLKESIHLFQPKHFLFPFLAHSLGTFFGAFFTVKFVKSHHQILAYLISIIFLSGGIANIIMLPGPLWFTVVDLLFAYIPMAFIAIRLGN